MTRFYQNMIQDQAAYMGDVANSGFSHEAPFQPPPRDEVFYDAQSEFAGGRDVPYPGSGGGGGSGRGPPPPPPPGNLGVFADLFGQRPGNLPIQSGYMAPPEVQPPPVQFPVQPWATRNFLQEEGVQLPPEPAQLGFL